MSSETGKWIIVIGMGIVLVGTLIYFFHDKLHWVGRLPGDIRIERGNFRFYFPITSMVLLSIIVSVIIRLIYRLLR